MKKFTTYTTAALCVLFGLPFAAGSAQAHQFHTCDDPFLTTEALSKAGGEQLGIHKETGQAFQGVICTWKGSRGTFQLTFRHLLGFMPRDSVIRKCLPETGQMQDIIGDQIVEVRGYDCTQSQKVMDYLKEKGKQW